MTTLCAQPPQSHSTISSVKVSYKSVSQTTASISAINGIPQTTITLAPSANASKIHFKILDNLTNAILYEINYSTNSQAIINNTGIKLFEKIGNLIYISNGIELPLRPYKYQLQTQDNLGNNSALYTLTK